MKCLKEINLKLGIVLVVQLALVVFLWWPKGSQTSISKKLFSGVAFFEMSEIKFFEPGKEMVLQKKNGSWVVPAQFDYPADGNKIKEFLGKLENLAIGQSVGKTKTGHNRFEVSDEKFQRKVSFGNDGFYLGSAPRFRSVHIRRYGQDEVFTTDQVSTYEIGADPKTWLEKKLITARSEEITGIEIQRGKDVLRFERVEKPAAPTEGETGEAKPPEKVWMLEGKPVQQSGFDAILRNLSDLQLTDVLGTEEKPDFGFKNPQMLIKVTYQQGDKKEEKTFAVGKKLENDFVVHDLDSPFYVKVASYQVTPALEVKKKDLLQSK